MSPSNRHWKPTRAAERDLEEIWRHTFQRWSTAQADSYHNDMIAAFIELAAGRRQGRKIFILNRA